VLCSTLCCWSAQCWRGCCRQAFSQSQLLLLHVLLLSALLLLHQLLPSAPLLHVQLYVLLLHVLLLHALLPQPLQRTRSELLGECSCSMCGVSWCCCIRKLHRSTAPSHSLKPPAKTYIAKHADIHNTNEHWCTCVTEQLHVIKGHWHSICYLNQQAWQSEQNRW
jgi:hypothetical protein